MITSPQSMNTGLALGLSLLAISDLAAQDQRADVASAVTFVRQADGLGIESYGRLITQPNATAWSDTQIVWENVIGSPLTQFLPMQRVLGGLPLSNTDHLFFGRRHLSGGGHQGIVARVQLDLELSTITVTENVVLPVTEPLSMAYDAAAERLLVLDGASRSILTAPWTAADSLADYVDLTRVTDFGLLPILGRPASCCLVARDGNVDIVESNGVKFTRLEFDGQDYEADTDAWMSAIDGIKIVRDSLFVPVNRPWELEVVGKVSTPLPATLRSEGKTPAQLSLVAGTNTVAPFAATDPSGKYGVLDAGPCVDLPFLTCVRYGSPQGAPLIALGELFLDPGGLYPGRTDFLIGTETLPHPVAGLTVSNTLSGELWIGVRAADGTDPVTVVGNMAVLNSLIGRIPFTVPAGDLPPTLTFALPYISVDLQGLTLFGQIVLTDGSIYAFTDVVGMQVRDASPMQTSSQSVSAPASAPLAAPMSMTSESLTSFAIDTTPSWDAQVDALKDALGDAADITPKESRAIDDTRDQMLEQ